MIGMFLLKLNALAKAVPWQFYALLFALAVAWFWGNSRYNEGREDEAAKRDAIVAAAVLKAVEAERKAAARHSAREGERQADTAELREVAEKAPVGSKVEAVLDALRSR